MKNSKLLLLFILVVGNQIISYGQKGLYTESTLQTPSEYYLQVKQFGEFIDRFNYKTDWKGNLITEEFSTKVPRANYLGYLLNAEDPRLGNSSDSSYREICSEFIAFIDNPKRPQLISLFSGQVVAWASVNITYAGQNHQANLEMIPEVLPDRSAKWVINRVECNWLKPNADSLQKHFIAPNSHETNFINLKKLNGSSKPINFFSPSVATTILFMSEVEKKRLLIQNIEKVTYRIVFPGWEITVDEFNRTSKNSGWLISNVKKI